MTEFLSVCRHSLSKSILTLLRLLRSYLISDQVFFFCFFQNVIFSFPNSPYFLRIFIKLSIVFRGTEDSLIPFLPPYDILFFFFVILFYQILETYLVPKTY